LKEDALEEDGKISGDPGDPGLGFITGDCLRGVCANSNDAAGDHTARCYAAPRHYARGDTCHDSPGREAL
jgi:hypothetical protein